ncbi:site-specific integrase [Rhodococcus qingshengii]|uniref:site-specific integrase n=1 Tax=Rhodococcus qingshengii TaxID=334542 RepID=UPI00211EA688|nr:site-specific integrase [Rhodococcus qingshengii]
MCSETRRADLAGLAVPDVGRLISTGSEAEPYRLLDASGEVIATATLFFEELHACDRSSATIRSYGHDLLRWWRFLAAVDVGWERATPAEGRDFARWMKIADKPRREHWRRRSEKVSGTTPVEDNAAKSGQWVVNEVTGKPRQGQKFSPGHSSARGNGVAGVLRFPDEHRCWAGRQSVPGGSLAPRFSVERASRSARSVS